MSQPKTMSRSRNQIATSYAPESFFTLEGGLGACLARSTAGESIDLPSSTLDLIFERMKELGSAWFSSAMNCRSDQADAPDILPQQCVDVDLLDHSKSTFMLPGQDRFYLCKPSHMEYTPAPLTFVCRSCGLFRDYDSLAALDADYARLTPDNCPDPKKKNRCDWEQLDVIFVHWSGHWEGAFPGKWDWNPSENRVVKWKERCVCSSADFRLNRRSSNIGDWFFECAACGKPLSVKWLQNDKDTLRMLGSNMEGKRYTEVRMQATPYRASNAYYVKADLFIDFRDGGQDIFERLRAGRESELKDFLAQLYGFSSKAPDYDEVKAACQSRSDCAMEWAKYQSGYEQAQALEEQLAGGAQSLPANIRQMMSNSLKLAKDYQHDALEQLRAKGYIASAVDLPQSVQDNLRERQSRFASKFDPFRLAVEHHVLKTTRLTSQKTNEGHARYVPFTNLDTELAPEQPELKVAQEAETRTYLDKLGMAEMGLIRQFDLCRFSFGYSRMESSPVLRDKRGMDMPVRLNLFPAVRQAEALRHPVYVLQQSNEALYVRLKPEQVLNWLKQLNCSDMFELRDNERFGAGVLGIAQPMSTFMDHMVQSDEPPSYYYLYTLLHSMSHVLMHQVAEYSGLDLGSLGEYIFPADLAFVVYRNGTTMDLGNLSALWRNVGPALLKGMLDVRATQCGTGTLCTHRGGACPDCVMVPEAACIASNKLLSRSVLRSNGGRPSRFDRRTGAIPGYWDMSVS